MIVFTTASRAAISTDVALLPRCPKELGTKNVHAQTVQELVGDTSVIARGLAACLIGVSGDIDGSLGERW